jgi:hypothetical protein
MKKLFAISILVLSPLTMIGASGLTVTCMDGATGGGSCAPGHVRFTGDQYPTSIHVLVTRTNDNGVHDNFDYDATNGVDFTEVLYPAGVYRVDITSPTGYAETKYVYSGVTQEHDDH